MTANMDAKYRLVAKDKSRLLLAVMHLLGGEDARISFEGSLSRYNLATVPGALGEETPALGRATLTPRQDFIVLPLGNNTIRAVNDCVSRGKKDFLRTLSISR